MMTAGTIAFQSWQITVMVERGSTELRTTLALISTRNSTSVVEQATSPSMLIMALAKVDPERIKPHEQPMVSSGQESRNLIRNAPVLLPLRRWIGQRTSPTGRTHCGRGQCSHRLVAGAWSPFRRETGHAALDTGIRTRRCNPTDTATPVRALWSQHGRDSRVRNHA